MHHPARLVAHAVNPGMPVHPLVEETLERSVVIPHRIGEYRDRPPQRADVVGRFCVAFGEARARLHDHVAHHSVDHSANRFVNEARLVDAGIAIGDLGEHRPDQRHVGQIGDREQPGAQPVVDIVVVVGDVVGERGNLRLRASIGIEPQILTRIVFGDRRRQRHFKRSVVLGDTFQRFPRQV